MFDKLKQIKELKELQGSLKNERLEVEKNGVKIVMNGNMELEEVNLNPELEGAEQERFLKECFNEAIKKLQVKIAQKMSGMTGFGL